MPAFFSWRSLIFCLSMFSVLLFLAQRPGAGALIFAASVAVWAAAGFPKVFQPVPKTRKSMAAEVADPPVEDRRDDIASCVGRLDPAWQVWLHRDNKD